MQPSKPIAPPDTLILRCQQGEQNAIVDLFQAYQQQVYRLAVTILHDQQDAEDVTQEVFLRVFKRIGEYRGESAFQTWLTAIVVNTCRDWLRRQRLRQWLPLQWLRGVSNPDQVDDMVEMREQRWKLWTQVERLNEKLRLPVILFYHEGMPADEVAKALDLPVSTIYARLNTARLQLRTALQEPEILETHPREQEIC